MTEKEMDANIRKMDKVDTLHRVITKLCAIGDFFQFFEDYDKIALYKQTPEGLGLIVRECIETLKELGEF